MLTVAMFRDQLGQRFQIHLDTDQAIVATLTEVSLLSEKVRVPNGREPFSLVFVGPLTPCLPQKIYRMVNDVMGATEIFLVPIGPGGGGMKYEAIFT